MPIRNGRAEGREVRANDRQSQLILLAPSSSLQRSTMAILRLRRRVLMGSPNDWFGLNKKKDRGTESCLTPSHSTSSSRSVLSAGSSFHGFQTGSIHSADIGD